MVLINSFRTENSLEQSSCVQASLSLPVAFTSRVKPSTLYLQLLAVLPRSFLSRVLIYTVFPCSVCLGSTCWAPWGLLAFFKICIVINLGEPNLLCALDLALSGFLLALVKGVPSMQMPAWPSGGFHSTFCFLPLQDLVLPVQHLSGQNMAVAAKWWTHFGNRVKGACEMMQ